MSRKARHEVNPSPPSPSCSLGRCKCHGQRLHHASFSRRHRLDLLRGLSGCSPGLLPGTHSPTKCFINMPCPPFHHAKKDTGKKTFCFLMKVGPQLCSGNSLQLSSGMSSAKFAKETQAWQKKKMTKLLDVTCCGTA